MCLYVLDSHKRKISNKDMVVYKTGIRLNEKEFRSVFFSYVYTKNQLNHIDNIVKIEHAKDYQTVEKGFHAYLPDKILNTVLHGDYVIGKFIISKGSQYYLGKNGDIVSNQIIFKKFVDEINIIVTSI